MYRKILNCTCVETEDGNIFRTLLDFQIPSTAVSYLKYYPSPNGTRTKENQSYSKFRNLIDGQDYVKSKLKSHWVNNSQLQSSVMIPGNHIVRIYNPIDVMHELFNKPDKNSLEVKICQLVKLISKKCEISLNKIGISGSNLVGLSDLSADSDIDLLVYGRESTLRLIDHLEELKEYGFVHYSDETRDKLIPRRQPATIDGFSQEVALTNEYTKTSGRFFDIHVNISPIREVEADLPEIFRAKVLQKYGFCIVKANILDNSEAIFVPPVYKIKVLEVLEGSLVVSDVKYVVGSRFLHAQVGEKDHNLIFAGILEKRLLEDKEVFDISLEPWETVKGFITPIQGE
ncbi:putative nucleotidyltransferase [Lactobacillus colini]|uniref:Nucleotidyltransferase n=1 Tax=Lactobacillus colini TaxID=1819254 RepID=A0ABS4MG84_9LACO|nr:hypothetical protein [Lactobacillus colini]MBP2058706.1 putative nucleotidyltransferase [Lactobacillus colini]